MMKSSLLFFPLLLLLTMSTASSALRLPSSIFFVSSEAGNRSKAVLADSENKPPTTPVAMAGTTTTTTDENNQRGEKNSGESNYVSNTIVSEDNNANSGTKKNGGGTSKDDATTTTSASSTSSFASILESASSINIPDATVATIVKSQESVMENLMSGEFGKRGEEYVVLQFGLLLCIFLGVIPLHIGDVAQVLLGPGLLLTGLVTILLAVTDLNESLSPWPVPSEKQKEKGLAKKGAFAMVRHPIYAGLLAGCVGYSIFTNSAIRLALTAALYYVLEKKSDFEESKLVEVFGDDYVQYMEEVPNKFFPRESLDKWLKKKN